ncbi:MAG: iron ABC transporter permease, partial [Candidatus Electrothrix sp. EH2]|nr:iron ABC transporter permease [Candidatus Electrothrix sp. EH2]
MADSNLSTIGIDEKYMDFTGRKVSFILTLVPLILLIAGIATSLGSADLTLGEAYTALLHKFFPDYFQSNWLAETCVWDLRLPRILMGILAGTGLGFSGCIIQGVLRNPLASPYTLGISSGAGFGASLAILAGGGLAGGQYLVIGSAFVFALISSFIIIGLASQRGARPETMILAGIAMTCLFGSATTILQYFGEAEAVKEAVFWMVGDLGRASWNKLSIVFVVLTVCLPLLIWKSWDLNVIGGGDESAESLGVNVKRTRIFVMIVSTLMVAS